MTTQKLHVMASLLTDPLYEISGRGLPPSKNFYHFAVTKSDVIWRWWKISLRAVDRYSKPGERRKSHQDFLDDSELQSEVSLVFGHQVLQCTKALCQGQYDYLEHLSDSLLLRIINYLELEDVGQLGRASRRFRQLCGSEEFWEQAVRLRCNTVSAEVASMALEVGWRSIFFTSKLQLQKLISRRRLKTKEQQKGQVSDPHTNKEESPDESSDSDKTSCSEEESHLGIIPNQGLGTVTGAGFDPSPNPEPEAGSYSSVPVSGQWLKDNCVVETPVHNSALSNGRGSCSAKPDKAQS